MLDVSSTPRIVWDKMSTFRVEFVMRALLHSRMNFEDLKFCSRRNSLTAKDVRDGCWFVVLGKGVGDEA
jgi:hypothetical protein